MPMWHRLLALLFGCAEKTFLADALLILKVVIPLNAGFFLCIEKLQTKRVAQQGTCVRRVDDTAHTLDILGRLFFDDFEDVVYGNDTD